MWHHANDGKPERFLLNIKAMNCAGVPNSNRVLIIFLIKDLKQSSKVRNIDLMNVSFDKLDQLCESHFIKHTYIYVTYKLK